MLAHWYHDIVSHRRINYDTYSKHRYKRIIEEVGGWPFHQRVVNVLAELAGKHETSVANIAARWVLNHPAVPAVIVGARNANHLSVRVLMIGFHFVPQRACTGPPAAAACEVG